MAEQARIQDILTRAIDLEKAERHDDAIDCYDQAIRIDSSCVLARVCKAILLKKLGRPKDALAEFEATDLEADEDIATWALYKKAVLLIKLTMPAGAMVCLDRITELDHNHSDAYFAKGWIHHEYYEVTRTDESLEESVRCYDQAIRAKPDNADAMYNKGLVLSQLRRPEDAIASFDDAIRARPDFAEAYDSKGSELNFVGKHDEAILCYGKAIKIKPDFAACIHNMANALYHADEIEESARLLDEAVRRDPELRDHADIKKMLNDRLEFNRNIHNACRHDHAATDRA